ncbi:MAG: methionyl-tRNA formyltransferase [Candidatus Aureabacteria bacterium]|nr:methionyl-tRNA formyltransferase [Candidatus Auribacterota bacterium]
MRIIFMGTPQFAVPSLEALAGSGGKPAAVITQPDQPQGRSLRVAPPPVKTRALSLGLDVLQPTNLADPGFMERITTLAPDLIAVVAYGVFLPRILWELPPRGTINLHPSLLPRYRGAAPVQHAILNGDAETGVTVAYLGEGMDAGDIIMQERVGIEPSDTGETLGQRLAVEGARLLLSAIQAIENGTALRVPQDGAAATQAPKLAKADGLINWRLSAESVLRRIRAFHPWPGAYTHFAVNGRRVRVKILDASVDRSGAGAPGTIAGCGSEGVRIGTGEGVLVVTMLQPEGKRVMSAAEFTIGCKGLEGSVAG